MVLKKTGIKSQEYSESIINTIREPLIANSESQPALKSPVILKAANIEMLLKHADIAMYHIKETGRDDYTRYIPGMGNG
jgi:hypothetical protein